MKRRQRSTPLDDVMRDCDAKGYAPKPNLFPKIRYTNG